MACDRRSCRVTYPDGVMLVAVGLVAGLAGAVALTRLMQGMLFGVSPTDPATFVAVPIVLTSRRPSK